LRINMNYLFLKLVHIGAVVLFLGNITTGLYWKLRADRSRDPAIIAHTFAGIVRSDRWFTLPGMIVIIAAGIWAAILGGLPLLGTGWILWSIVLFALSGLVFMARVVPLQTQLAEMTRRGAAGGEFDWPRNRTMSRAWELWGLLALLAPAAAVVLMVMKPALPALSGAG
jgi:uncharacterized membrane protein